MKVKLSGASNQLEQCEGKRGAQNHDASARFRSRQRLSSNRLAGKTLSCRGIDENPEFAADKLVIFRIQFLAPACTEDRLESNIRQRIWYALLSCRDNAGTAGEREVRDGTIVGSAAVTEEKNLGWIAALKREARQVIDRDRQTVNRLASLILENLRHARIRLCEAWSIPEGTRSGRQRAECGIWVRQGYWYGPGTLLNNDLWVDAVGPS